MSTPPIQWYPGHIARAQRQLKQQLQKVDVIFEVLDARIPQSSRNADLDQWTNDKPRVIVLNKADCVPAHTVKAWQAWFQSCGQNAWPTNARDGKGVAAIEQAAHNVGQATNDRRRKRGMKPRAVRAVVIGFPNVGKSALLNRLLGKRVVESARKPGVTRQLRWVRLGKQLDILDAPGILPPQLNDQQAALKLAICDDIGQASYVTEHVAASFLEMLPPLDAQAEEIACSRYGFDSLSKPGSILIQDFALRVHAGNTGRAAQQILTDFRKGTLGEVALELPPDCT
ncbi:MAG: ribosome biogenesis GTPase YlqF [Cyanobacteria bacterium P01_G01_bin.4]